VNWAFTGSALVRNLQAVIEVDSRGMGNLKGFLLISAILHLVFLAFMPGSIFHSQMDTPEPPDPIDFFLVDYMPMQEQPPEEPIHEPEPVVEPEPDPEPEPEPEVEEIEEELEEPPVEEALEDVGPEELEEPPAEKVEEDLALEEIEEAMVAEDLLEDLDAPPVEEDITIALETAEEEIMTTDLSDEYVYLPELLPPSSDDLESALQPEEPEEEAVEEEEEPGPAEPQLPQEPVSAVLAKTTPVLPKDAANEGIEGTVEIMVLIDQNGRLREIEFLQSSGDDRIDSQARLTIERLWEFSGQPRDYYLHLVIDFTLQEVTVEFLDIFFAEEGD